MNKIIILLSLLLSIAVFSQKQKDDMYEKTSFVVENKLSTYKEINNQLRPFKRDTSNVKIMIDVFDKANFFYGKTYAQNQLGIKYRNFSLYDKAIATHKKALETAKQAKSIEFQVFSLNMAGVVYRRLDDYRIALDYSQEALELANQVKEPNRGILRGIAIAHNSMGNIYLLLKQYELAIGEFKKSQIIEKQINNQLGLAINYQNIGYAKEALGKDTEALEQYEKSLKINKDKNNKLGKVICNSSIAHILIKQNELDKAMVLIKINLPIIEELGNKYYHAFELLNLGWAQAKLNKLDVAEYNILKGLEIAEEFKLKSAKSMAYSYLSKLYSKQNNYKESLKFYQLADQLESEISNESTMKYVNGLIIKYDSERKNSKIINLAKQNEISKLQLTKNRNLLIASVLFLIFSSIIVFILYKNQKLSYEKEKVKLEQTALRSQMNPHFIFNSLNSIKLYIIENEKENAVYYLNKFSKLIRKILAATKQKETALSEEIETMKLYINIENIRFLNSIETHFIVDKGLNVNTIKIPSLILQPFIENAIWHGLSSKKKDKKIQLSFKKEHNTYLVICIEDNGIGREKALEIKQNKIHKRESIGIQLTEDRLENFAKSFKNDFYINFVDLYDGNKKPRGTKVILKIPLK